MGGEGLRDAELHRLLFRIRRGLRILRMEHLLEAPPLVHRDHREPPRVVRNLLEPAELADRNPHPCHPDDLHKSRAILTFAAESRENRSVQPASTSDQKSPATIPESPGAGPCSSHFHPSSKKELYIMYNIYETCRACMPGSAAGVPR